MEVIIIDIRKLTYFIILAETESFTLASQTLHISQPSLSYAIQKLEEDIGMQLFERKGKKVILTDMGAQSYKVINTFINHYEALKKDLEYIKNNGSGTISIGMIEAVKNWVPELMKQHQKNYNNQRFELHEVLTYEEMVESLQKFDIHVCISNHKLQDEFIECELLYEEEFVLLTNNNYFNDTKKSISLSEIEKLPLIITPNKFLTHKDILQEFDKLNITPNIKFKVERFETACTLVKYGLGLTILPRNFLLSTNDKNFSQLKIIGSKPKRKVYLLYNKKSSLTNSINDFIRICRLYCEQNLKITK